MIGDKIKLLREAKGLTQQQIAQDPAFGIKQGTLSAYERNAREPNVETIRKIAEYFGVTADYLIGISEHKTAEHDAVGQIIPLSDAAIVSLRTYAGGACQETGERGGRPTKGRPSETMRGGSSRSSGRIPAA